MKKEMMSMNVITEVGKLIGKTEGEVWSLVRDGVIKIDYGPKWSKDGDSDEMSINIYIGKVA